MNLPKTKLTNDKIEKILLDYGGYCIENNSTYNSGHNRAKVDLSHLIHQAEITAKIAMVNQLFDGWIDYETNAKWRYMSIKHRNQIIEVLEKEIIE